MAANPTPDRKQTEPDASREGDLSGADPRLLRLRSRLHQEVVRELDLSTIGAKTEDELRKEVGQIIERLCRSSPDLVSSREQTQLVNDVIDEMFGLGAIEPLLRDPNITDILINGSKAVYVERFGKLKLCKDVAFKDDRHVIQVVQRIVGRVGRRVDETSPMVDARLADGSRINAVIPPLAVDGPLVSIRRFGRNPLRIEDLLAKESLTPEIVKFLQACVMARLNVLISGGTGSGKTTLLNAMSVYIPDDERVVTIEDAAELRLQQPHVCRLETRPPNIEGVGVVTTRDLVRNALRMRPDRIIVGECRGAEALDMLQALNTGHEGSLSTIHANDTRDALSRLEMMVTMAGFDVPVRIVRAQIGSAIQVLVHIARLRGGARKVVRVSEITGMEQETILLQDIFVFKQTGVDRNRCAVGEYHATGIRPECLHRLDVAGFGLPVEMFEARILRTAGGKGAAEQ